MPRLTQLATALTLAIAGLALNDAKQALADANAAVCAQTYGKSDGLSCNYANYDQCRAFISGIAGSCVDNPYRRGALAEMPRAKKRR